MQAPTQQQQYESNIVQILSMQRNQAQDALVDAQARLAVASEEIKPIRLGGSTVAATTSDHYLNSGERRDMLVLQLVQPAVPAQPAVQAREAYTETVREAGNRYSLRLDQLAWFVATAGA